MTKKTRNIGIGIMGFADMLVKLGSIYGSEQSLEIAEAVMAAIQESAHQASVELGCEKGNFPAFAESVWPERGREFMRNTRITTIAPTGTISIIANCNPGIEPIFALGYRRKNSMGGIEQEVIEPLIETVAKKFNFFNEAFLHQISQGKTLAELAVEYKIPAEFVAVFRTAHEIEPEDHVYIQAAFQKHIDSAVSKTINLPRTASWKDIARLYMLAYDLKCKGITVFRDGSKDPALQVGTQDKQQIGTAPGGTQNNQVLEVMPRNTLEPRKRDEFTTGRTYEVKTEQGDLYVTINSDSSGIVEVFLNLGKSGSFTAGYTEALGRLISMSLRSGIKPESIIKQLQGIRTSSPTLNKGMIVYSVPDAVAKIIKKYLEEKEQQMKLLPVVDEKVVVVEPKPESAALQEVSAEQLPVKQKPTKIEPKEIQPNPEITQDEKHYSRSNHFGDLLECPECGSDLEYAEGCILCRSCGYSKCG